MSINVKDKFVTLESLGVAYSAEQDAREEADQALSTRIDNIVAPEGDPSLTEVSDARVSGSTTHNTLKARLDADQAAVGTEISAIKADLGDKIDLPSNGYGVSGKVLKSTGSGTEWASVGQPTDAQTTEAVSDWLDEHPEATTTVQDGSLTEAKFSNALKLKTINDYVTPQMFGAKGDGTTDDTLSIQSAISTGKPVCIPDGTYIITDTLQWTSVCMLHMSSNAIIKAKDNTNLPCLLGIRNDGNSYSNNANDYIDGGIFDGNFCCDTIIGINYTSGVISNCRIKNIKRVGLYIRHNLCVANRGNGSLNVNNVYIVNDSAQAGTVGIFSGGTDDSYLNITTRDLETGFNVGSGSIVNACHAWISFATLFENSKAFVIRGSGSLLSGCVSDSMRYAVKTVENYSRITITNFSYYFNSAIIPAEIVSQYPPVAFDVYSDKTLLSVTNFDAGLSNYSVKILSDNAISSSFIKFVNINIQNASNASNIPRDIASYVPPTGTFLRVVNPSGGNVTQALADGITDNCILSGYSSITDYTGWCTLITIFGGTTLVQTLIIRGKGVYVRRKASGAWDEFS